MNAITLWQPWATWIAWGWKTAETRGHNRFRGLAGQRIAIHAGQHWDPAALVIAGPWLTGQQEQLTQELRRRRNHVAGRVVCTAEVIACRRLVKADSPAALCLCTSDRYGLFLDDIRPGTPDGDPFPGVVAGHQGIWDWTPPWEEAATTGCHKGHEGREGHEGQQKKGGVR